eukprot:5231389-Prymnesium_polylepis.2
MSLGWRALRAASPLRQINRYTRGSLDDTVGCSVRVERRTSVARAAHAPPAPLRKHHAWTHPEENTTPAVAVAGACAGGGSAC